MSSRSQPPTLDSLRARTHKVFRHGGGTRPEVRLVEFNGKPAVLKDYAHSDPWFRLLVGPLSARREARALRRVAGVRGVPRLLAAVGTHALLLEYLPGENLHERSKQRALPTEFFDKFERLIEDIHRRGIAHCDLRSRGNILIGPQGDPYVVDFVAHFKRGRRWNPLTRWMYAKFRQADRIAVIRLKRGFARDLVTPEERAVMRRDRKGPLGRAARALGKSIRALSRWLLTNSRK